MSNALLQEAQALAPWLQEKFFDLHRNPELGRQEYKTQARVLAELEKMGFKKCIIPHGSKIKIKGEGEIKKAENLGDLMKLCFKPKTSS